jgi:hypothetical protein
MRHVQQIYSASSLVVSLALAVGCNHPTEAPTGFYFTGLLAGAPWLGDAQASLANDGTGPGTLYLLGLRPRNAGQVPQETIAFHLPFAGVGVYSLTGDAVRLTALVGGDGIVSEYGGQGPTVGTVEIDSYDAVTGVITGAASFVADVAPRYEYRPHGSTARFTMGRFRACVRSSATSPPRTNDCNVTAAAR